MSASSTLASAKPLSVPDAPLVEIGRRFGDYELLEELGRGGMGIVYKARQASLGRHVAVKLLHFGPLASPEFVKRLRMEATSAGCLQHPNIVAIHEVGIHQDQHYLVMDFVAGPNLATLAASQSWLAGKAAPLVRSLAEAIHFAHERGILHRDLKPSNILVDEQGQPKITDFGLAKRLSTEHRSLTTDHSDSKAGSNESSVISDQYPDLTVTGQVLGSPNYMPPEQASASKGKVGRPSDVYSLGAILYHLLTGRPPFVGETITATLHQVLETEAASPRLLNPRVPVDIETICLKCLEKEPERRYATAQALADELERFLKGEPILARPINQAQRFWRWCRRNPVVASLAGATLGLLLTVAIGSPIAAYRINRERAQTEEQRIRAVKDQAEARRLLYISSMNLVQQAWEQNNVGRVRQLLDETVAYSERGFEWSYWQRQTHLELKTLRGHMKAVWAVAFSPDSQRIVTGSQDQTVRVWEPRSGRELLTINGHNSGIRSVAFSPDGQRIVSGSRDQTAKVWDATNGRELLTLKGHSAGIETVAFSPDGRRIGTGGFDQTAKVWDATDGRELLTLKGHSAAIWSLAFSPEGQRMVTTSDDLTVRVWDVASGKELLRLKGQRGPIWSVAFSPDGQRIVTSGDEHTAKVWDVNSGLELLAFNGHSSEISSVAFSSDGQWIVTGSWDQTAKAWQVASGNELFTVQGHSAAVLSVAVSLDGKWIVTGSDDGTAKVWDATERKRLPLLQGHRAGIRSVVFSEDGQRLLTASSDQRARVWSVTHGTELLTFDGHTAQIRAAVFSPDGQRIVTASDDRMAKVWSVASGKELLTCKGHSAGVWSVDFSSDGSRLISGSMDQTAKVWDAASGKELLTLRGHRGGIRSVAFSPDGQRVVTGSMDHTAKVWDATSGKEVCTLRGHRGALWSGGFSSDGQRIVTCSGDRTAKIWEASSGKELLTVKGHRGEITSAAFSPDGQRLVTGSEDQSARVWETASGRELLKLNGHSGWIWCVTFSPDGRRILTGSEDQTVLVWEAATTEQIALWQKEEQAAAEYVAAEEISRTDAAERHRARRAKDEGVIKRWLVLAPIAFAGLNGASALQQEQIAQEGQLRPQDGLAATIGDRELVWRAVPTDDSLLDFERLVGEPTYWHVAYAVCYIKSDTDQSGLIMRIGSDDQAKVYLNGREIFRNLQTRPHEFDHDSVTGVELKAGNNVLVFKVINEKGGWQGSIRLTDASGQPVKGVKVNLDP